MLSHYVTTHTGAKKETRRIYKCKTNVIKFVDIWFKSRFLVNGCCCNYCWIMQFLLYPASVHTTTVHTINSERPFIIILFGYHYKNSLTSIVMVSLSFFLQLLENHFGCCLYNTCLDVYTGYNDRLINIFVLLLLREQFEW